MVASLLQQIDRLHEPFVWYNLIRRRPLILIPCQKLPYEPQKLIFLFSRWNGRNKIL